MSLSRVEKHCASCGSTIAVRRIYCSAECKRADASWLKRRELAVAK